MSAAVAAGTPGRRTIPLSEEAVVAGAAVLAAVGGLLVVGAGGKPFAAVLAAVIFVAVVIRPQFGAYLFLVASPLIAGVARGDALPILRPNEALFILVLAAFATRTCCAVLAGKAPRLAVNRIDTALILLVVAASIMPLLLRFGRGLPVTEDDVLYAMVLLKYFVLYLVFRGSVSTPAQVAACLWLSLASAAVVAVVAILQVNSLFGVPELLSAYYDQPFEGHTGPVTERGTSTLASSFGVADVMAMNLVVVIAWLRGRRRGRGLLVAAALLFVSGCIVAGAFSGFIGLAVAVLAVGCAIGRLHRVLAIAAPATVVAAALFWPVIAGRLAGFGRPSGLPHSWEGRWENLQRFFFPELSSGVNWLVGVRPAPRLPAPEAWRDWVYIESGYVWLLWIGGVPLLAAFAGFAWIALRELGRVARVRNDAVGVAAAAGFAYLVVIVVLMLFDPHLTVRGSADLFFPLLALALVRGRVTDGGGSADRARRGPSCHGLPLRPPRRARRRRLPGPPLAEPLDGRVEEPAERRRATAREGGGGSAVIGPPARSATEAAGRSGRGMSARPRQAAVRRPLWRGRESARRPFRATTRGRPPSV